MQTGENEQALRKISDMSRFIAIILLMLHFYFYCYGTFISWGLTVPFTDKLLRHIGNTGLFEKFNYSKYWALLFLMISSMGIKGKKDDKLSFKPAFAYIVTGLILYFFSNILWNASHDSHVTSVLYMAITSGGFLLIISGATLLTRVIKSKLKPDIFNTAQETFPQEERHLENEYSINLSAKYLLKGKYRKSWVNVINPFRGNLVMGTPGSGKSYFVIRHVITQHIQKGFSMFVYDFKLPDLSIIVYNTWLKYKHLYPVEPSFYVINFDDLSRTHRCNPLDSKAMTDITDAAESARTILIGLNREWIKKQGDFFIESAINFVTAIIWFLKKYEGGKYCTLPHVIELMQVEYEKLFVLLQSEKEIEVLINPFINAYKNEAMEQLEGQIASAKVAMAKLSSPQLYYVLSGNDFSLDINDPEKPKLVCMGNNPQKIQIYGAVLSLYVNRLAKLVNQKNKLKSSLIFDEFPTIYLNGIDSLIATARSNKVSTTLGIQDLSQLRKDYGREQADVIMGIVGNVISGQVTGDTAKQLSDRVGRIMQDRESISINSGDTSISRSKQLEAAVPASKISALSSGQFVGMVADDPQNKIGLKAFHNEILNDHKALKRETDGYVEIPQIRKINAGVVEGNYLRIKNEVGDIL
ncbi:type IV secretory system conjugative DNA transfer family protein [Pedobacter sp. SD-b]|uniref:Type IV secretory system conjugative DNA transfer family protein n=1 Tax=Pedobacter segetis TaxID=2793069 RepID=A0ABS1BMQ7_9SPHI|nr:conjugal transfer protein MobC [Pedobacter segetis]MBK0383591.1 type IV secretory system conjugative DNA transfer family protein [Pedobacter segetis]